MRKAGIGCLVVFIVLAILGVIGGTQDAAKEIADSTATRAPTMATVDSGDGTRVEVKPDSVILDFKRGHMTLVSTVPRSALSADGSGYLWAFFLDDAGGDGSRSDQPIPVKATGQGDPVRVSGRASFHWASNAAAPDRGYVARVFVGASDSTLPQRAQFRDKNRSTMHVVRTIPR